MGVRTPPGKMTSGVSSGSHGAWRYWTRVDGKVTFGPRRHDRDQAARDLKECLAGRPPAKKAHCKISPADRKKLGLCSQCAAPRVPGRRMCKRHKEIYRANTERRRRAAGVQSLAQHRRTVSRKRRKATVTKARHLTRDVFDTKLARLQRCPCGLLLPCYHPGIEDYASARPGGGE